MSKNSNRPLFIIIAIALVVIAAALVLPPLFKGVARGTSAAATAPRVEDGTLVSYVMSNSFVQRRLDSIGGYNPSAEVIKPPQNANQPGTVRVHFKIDHDGVTDDMWMDVTIRYKPDGSIYMDGMVKFNNGHTASLS